MVRIIVSFLAVWLQMTSLNAQSYEPSFRPDELQDQPAGPQNQVVVLGTPHLSGLPENFKPEMVNPVVDRFSDWKPEFIAVEDMSGLRCAAMKQMPTRFASQISRYCYDTTAAEAASGLSVFEAVAEIQERLENLDAERSPSERRRNALLFLAAGEPGSALVQWLYLKEEERIATDGLTEELVLELEKSRTRVNEVNLIAAPIAMRAGLERLWSVDAQDYYAGDGDEAAYAAALTAAWDNPSVSERLKRDRALSLALGEPGELLALYRAYNAPEYASLAYAGDWGAALTEPSSGRYGRKYVAYWETRNLRMVANMREVLGRSPGSRMLSIVGASHKAYYEAYLSQMRDVALVDVVPMLTE
ncbi:MAG: DUF5694 domain-containing protein [Pseudomonadota bacterium]